MSKDTFNTKYQIGTKREMHPEPGKRTVSGKKAGRGRVS